MVVFGFHITTKDSQVTLPKKTKKKNMMLKLTEKESLVFMLINILLNSRKKEMMFIKNNSENGTKP